MPASRAFKLRLFPNTGHQFFTLDLEELLTQRRDPTGRAVPPPPLEQIRQFVLEQQPHEAAREKRDRLAGWKEWHPDTKWILFRYDVLPDPRYEIENRDRPVLQLAIESNLGDWGRGTIYGLDHGSAGAPAAPHPLNTYLRQGRATAPGSMAGTDAFPPYVSRSGELFSDFPEKGMWLEDAFGGGRVRLPSRLDRNDPKAQRYLDYYLPAECVRIEWIENQRERPIDVDLIVDLGNTRTVALLLEDHGLDARPCPFGERVEVVRFVPQGWSYRSSAQLNTLEPFGLIDSWILLHRSTFANLEPPFSGDKLRTDLTEAPGRPGIHASVHLIDQRFVSLAPIVVGGGREATGAAKTLAWAALAENAKDAAYFLSSPKRYAWDDVSMGLREVFWRLVPNRHDADTRQPGNEGPSLADFDGLLRLFMNPGDPNFDLPAATIYDGPFTATTDPTRKASYPRRDAICWFALAILEAAYRQLHSAEFRESSRMSFKEVLRRLRHVRVTYPSGWTGEERECYLDQWRRALRLFAIAHLADARPQPDGEAPVLVEDPIDEAIASQLPVLVAEVKNLGNDVAEWLRLYGNGSEVRVMNIDIGGGTTDVAVISYSQPPEAGPHGGGGKQWIRPAAEMNSTLEFRDGTNVAGDVLVKQLIERIILPAWLKVRGDVLLTGNAEARKVIETLFAAPEQAEVSDYVHDASRQLGRIVRLALIPLANEVLARLVEAERVGADRLTPIRVSNVIDSSSIEDLNRLVLRLVLLACGRWSDLPAKRRDQLARNEAEFTAWFRQLQTTPEKLPFSPKAELELTTAELNAVIDLTFGPMLRHMGRVAATQRADLVILSGKPSELPRMRALVVQELPLLPQRIVHVRGYCVGDWYPAALVEEGGRIRDAKTVTVTGAALYEDIKNRNTAGLRLIPTEANLTETTQRFYWGFSDGQSFQGDFICVPEEAPRVREFTVTLGSHVGRSLDPNGKPEPVYRLSYRVMEGEREPKEARDATVRVTLQLTQHPRYGFGLELVPGSVAFPDEDDTVLNPDRVKLTLCTMVENDFWMDRPRFVVDFSKIGTSA